MNIDLDKLAGATARARAKRPPTAGVARFVSRLRRDPATRNRLPLQAIVLPPIPYTAADGWQLVSLLAAPAASGGIQAPWGVATWQVDARGELTASPAITNLDDLPHTATARVGLPSIISLSSAPAPAQRRALYQALDSLVQQPSSPSTAMSHLGPVYRGLLPSPLYDLAHAVAPGSALWLTAGA